MDSEESRVSSIVISRITLTKGEEMKRRDSIKLSAVAGGSLLASNWLLESEFANAASNEITSKNGILQLTLVADEKLIKYGNTTRWAMTYNGIFPAPTLRANPGDTLKITLVNKLNQATNCTHMGSMSLQQKTAITRLSW